MADGDGTGLSRSKEYFRSSAVTFLPFIGSTLWNFAAGLM
jgi:hypothetical protein